MPEDSPMATGLVMVGLAILLIAGCVYALSYQAMDAAQTHDSAKLSFYDESPGCGSAERIGSGSCNSEVFTFGLAEMAVSGFCVWIGLCLLALFVCILAGMENM